MLKHFAAVCMSVYINRQIDDKNKVLIRSLCIASYIEVRQLILYRHNTLLNQLL